MKWIDKIDDHGRTIRLLYRGNRCIIVMIGGGRTPLMKVYL